MEVSDIGRELRVSELTPHSVVVVSKAGRRAALTMWVRDIGKTHVGLFAGELNTLLLLSRCGDDLEQVQDEDRVPMKIFEYLGEI